MRKIKTNAKTLQEHYDILTKLADTPSNRRSSYLSATDYHHIIKEKMIECESFTEFGICQGHTLAVALFTHPYKVTAYDIDLKWYNPSKELFEKYAKDYHIEYKIFQADTSSCSVIEKTDMLHIDSQHTYRHARAELNRHAQNVNKFILFHDTTAYPGIWQALSEYISANPSWIVEKRSQIGVGYTLLKKQG